MSATLDAHVHVWDRTTDPQPWIDPASMASIDRDFSMADAGRMLDDVGVARAIVVQSSNSAGETLRLLRGATDRVAGVVGWIDLTDDVALQLDALASDERRRLVGVRHLVHIDPDRLWLARPDVLDGLAALGEARLSFDVVARWWQLPLVETVVKATPETTFVVDHLGGPPIGTDDVVTWAGHLEALALHHNVVAKLSGVAGEIGRPDWDARDCSLVFDVAFESFGPTRLMYGSDWPLVELVGGAAKWHDVALAWTSALSHSERAAVFGSTGTAAYRIAGEE